MFRILEKAIQLFSIQKSYIIIAVYSPEKKVGFIQRFTQRKLLKSIKIFCILYWIRGAHFIKNFIENIGWIEYDFCETIDRDGNETPICHCKLKKTHSHS